MLPETIELWAGRLTAWAAFSGAFAGIATIGALIFSNWDGDNKAEALKQYKEDAKKDADEVKKKVALAGEGQAKANESIALANERTALAELKIEEMRAKNSELARRVDPRTLGEHKPFGLELTAFKGTKARIEYLSNDEECRKIAESLSDALLTWAGWDVPEYPIAQDQPVIRAAGIRIWTSPTPSSKIFQDPAARAEWESDGKELEKAINPLIVALRSRGLDASRYATLRPFDFFKGIVISVGPKPLPNEAEDMRLFEMHLGGEKLSPEEKQRLERRDDIKRWMQMRMIPKSDEPGYIPDKIEPLK